MTRIDFYTHAADKVQVACRLTLKAREQGLRVLIYTPDRSLAERIDKLLWTTPAIGFVPHCRADDRLAGVTPVIIGHAVEAPPHDEVLLNLRPETPPFFSRFQRVIEIIGHDAEDSEAGRSRYRFYRDRGYEIRHHKLGGDVPDQ
ncbi:MAG: DNA polymerase III subunit chi [Betaproteobacteria bacterium]|nr:DNA polymerase III subunit chi [Betaproteobacteria bacterium]